MEVCAQWTASSAKSTAHPTCPANLARLFKPEAPLVAHFDPVVEEADDAERHHGQYGQVAGP